MPVCGSDAILRNEISEWGLNEPTPINAPVASNRLTIVPAGTALVSAVMSISFEKTHGLPDLTRFAQPCFIFTAG